MSDPVNTPLPLTPPSTSATSVPAASNHLYDIPSLENDGSNFATWKFCITTVLDIRGLNTIVNVSCPRPQQSASNYSQWIRADKEAKAQICLTLKDKPLSSVLHVATSKEAWDKLCECYEGKGKQSMAYLIGKLFRNTLSDKSSMELQLIAMQQKSYVLKSLGLTLEDPLVAIAMVISLPESCYSRPRSLCFHSKSLTQVLS